MSHLQTSQLQRQRTARKPVVTSPRQAPPPKRLNQRDLDSSCHRLSRVPQKFVSNKAIQNERSDSFAVNYFKKNPDAKDSTPPDQKLQEIDEKLKSEDLDTSDRFTLLVRQKALRYILYGENSVEALRSHEAIGIFYNQNNRSASAIRHLTKARQLEEQNDIDREESLLIAIETAEAYINIRTEKKSENQRNFNNAEKVLTDWVDEEIEDPMLRYRRDLCLARINYNKGKIEESIAKYEEAWQSLDEANSGEEKVETATLFYELARVYEYDENRKKSAEYFQKAYDIYKKLEMEEEAQMIEPFLPTEEELQEFQEAEENQKENEEEENNENNNEEDNNEEDNNEEDVKEKSTSQKLDSEKNIESENNNSDTEKNNSDENKENSNEDDDKKDRSSSQNSNKDESEDDNEEKGRAENLLGAFGDAILNKAESTEKSETEKDDDDNEEKSSSPNNDDENNESNEKSETDNKQSSTAEDDSEDQRSSEKPKLSDTGGFDDFE